MGRRRRRQISNGDAPLVGGWDIFCKSNNNTDAIFEMHQDLLQLAIEQLDLKVGLGVAATQRNNKKYWSEQCAMIIMQYYI